MDLTQATWFKSSKSGPNCDNCVEVALRDRGGRGTGLEGQDGSRPGLRLRGMARLRRRRRDGAFEPTLTNAAWRLTRGRSARHSPAGPSPLPPRVVEPLGTALVDDPPHAATTERGRRDAMTTIGSENLTNGPGRTERFGGKYRSARRDTSARPRWVAGPTPSRVATVVPAPEQAGLAAVAALARPEPAHRAVVPAGRLADGATRVAGRPPAAARPAAGAAAEGERPAARLAGPVVRGDPGDPGTAIRAGSQPQPVRRAGRPARGRCPAASARRAGCAAGRGVPRWRERPARRR